MNHDRCRLDAPESPASQAWHLHWELQKANRFYLESVATEFGLTPQMMWALKHLDLERKPVPMSELANVLSCDASSVTATADRLERSGFVVRQAAPNDRRVKALVLTDAGVAMKIRIFARMQRPPASFDNLSVEDQLTLCTILRRALSHADPAYRTESSDACSAGEPGAAPDEPATPVASA